MSIITLHLQLVEMINLEKAIPYETIDSNTIAVFNRYKWALMYLGIKFDQEILEAIVYSIDLENSLRAFCGWTLSLKENNKQPNSETSKQNLIESIKEQWIPSVFQEQILRQYQHILESPRDKIWKKASQILGKELRDTSIVDILENGTILFRENISNGINPEEIEKIKELKLYAKNLVTAMEKEYSYF